MGIKFNRSQTFATNGTVTAAGLHNLVDGLDIYQALITDQTSLTNVATDDSILIADASLTSGDAPKQTTVSNLFDDALTGGTYTNANFTGNLTYGTATGNRTVSTSATITAGTINNATIGTTICTSATITNLTTGTTNSTAATITTGTIPTGTFGTTTSTAATITTGTISNLSTTLSGDITISQGTATLGTTGVTAGTYGGSSVIPTITVDAKGRITTVGTSLATTGYTGFRNRIINGDMRIDQRNAGASQSITAASPSYSVDRWFVRPLGGTVTGQRIAGSGSSQYEYQITGGASVTQLQFEQRIEASNCYDLSGGNATISASLSNSLLTTANWILYYANSTDNFSSSTAIASGSWTITSTKTRYNATVSIPSAATTGLYLIIYVGAQTSGTFKISDVQLEAGSAATEFERRPIGTELALCQRYYYQYPPQGSGAVNSFVFPGGMQTGANCLCPIFHPVEMRAGATLTAAGVASDYYVIVNSTTVNCTSLPALATGSTTRGVALTFPMTANVGYAAFGAAGTSTAKLSFSSEL